MSSAKAYDTPGLCSVEFLFTIMRDPDADLHDRIDAARKLCELGLSDIPTIRELKIVIEGGMPDEGAEGLAKPSAPQYGIVSDAGCAADHRPPRRHRGFYLVKNA